MNRVLYKALLWLHPPAFRKRFGGEMLWIFDEAGPHRVLAFFRDAVISVTRQWILRSGSSKIAAAMICAVLQMGVGGLGWLLWMSSNNHRRNTRPVNAAIMNNPPLLVALLTAAAALTLVVKLTLWLGNFTKKRLLDLRK